MNTFQKQFFKKMSSFHIWCSKTYGLIMTLRICILKLETQTLHFAISLFTLEISAQTIYFVTIPEQTNVIVHGVEHYFLIGFIYKQ